MKCPGCAAAELIQDTRDLPYIYNGESTVIPAVTGQFCPACGEVVLGMAESQRATTWMLDFHGQVNAAIANPLVLLILAQRGHVIECQIKHVQALAVEAATSFRSTGAAGGY